MTKLPAQVYDATDNPDGGSYLRTPYDEDFLAEFKAAVPTDHRTWGAFDREWWVSDKYAKKALRIMSGYFNIEYCD